MTCTATSTKMTDTNLVFLYARLRDRPHEVVVPLNRREKLKQPKSFEVAPSLGPCVGTVRHGDANGCVCRETERQEPRELLRELLLVEFLEHVDHFIGRIHICC